MSRATQTFSSRITLRIRSPGPMVSRPTLGLRSFQRPQEEPERSPESLKRNLKITHTEYFSEERAHT